MDFYVVYFGAIMNNVAFIYKCLYEPMFLITLYIRRSGIFWVISIHNNFVFNLLRNQTFSQQLYYFISLQAIDESKAFLKEIR